MIEGLNFQERLVCISGQTFKTFPRNHIFNLHTSSRIWPCNSGLYFLFDNDSIVYIGLSTTNIFSRLKCHTKDKDFSHFSFCIWATGDTDLFTTERKLIEKFNPFYNITHCEKRTVAGVA